MEYKKRTDISQEATASSLRNIARKEGMPVLAFYNASIKCSNVTRPSVMVYSIEGRPPKWNVGGQVY